MRIGRVMGVALCALLLATSAFAQRGPAGQKLRVDGIAPQYVETSKTPTTVTLSGEGFDPKAVVRVRPKGERGAGVDVAAVVDSPRALRVTIAADMLAKPSSLELRVKNPDGALSEWATLEVRASSGSGGGSGDNPRPVIEEVTPLRVVAKSRNVHVTIRGRGLADGATVTLTSDSGTSKVRGNLANGALVILMPDEQLAKAQNVSVVVTNPSGVASNRVDVEVIAAPAGGGGGGPTTPTDPFIAQIDPQRVDMRGAPSRKIELIVRNVDPVRSYAVLRVEGDGTQGKRVAIVDRAEASNGSVLTIELTPAQVREAPAYELRIVNPDGRQSNWVRLEIANNADTGVDNTGAVVLAQFPGNVTLTATSATVPVELAVRNAGRAPVRLTDFAVVTPEGTTTPVAGELEVPVGAQRNVRLETPVPFALGAGSRDAAKYQMALTYRITAAGPVRPGVAGRYPETGFATVAVRNEIGLVAIGREFLRASETNGAEGWRFFKADKASNADQGTAADFYLFAEPFAASQKRPTEAVYNFRPDASSPNDRMVSFLTLRASEADDLARRDARARERGALLGYVATEQAPGLVPLYRWVLSDGRRTINHFLTTSRDASKLPRQNQGKGWRLEGPVGFVVPR